MKWSSLNTPGSSHLSPSESGRSTAILLLIVFLLGAAVAGVWSKFGTRTVGSQAGLSDPTVERLRHLNAPVEIRFYSILPSGSAPASLSDFSRRVDQLLSEFQAANEGKIRVTRNLSVSGASADAATADGIRPFNLEKGDACFLGLTVVSGERKESLAQLQPEWEPALPYDLARTILNVTATPSAPTVRSSPPVSPETTNAIRRLIPDVKGTSLEDGTAILRQATVDQFSKAGAEMEKQIQIAQQQLAEAQANRSEAEQQAAMKHLQQVQLEQGEKLKAIAAQLQEQISVFTQMKSAPTPAN